jgi:hypothetical protein
MQPRFLPRILWICGIAAVVAAVVIVSGRGSDPPHETVAPASTTPGATASTVKPRAVPLRPAVSKVVLRFVKTAVMRTHASRTALLAGWALTGPKLREGTTLEEWLAGTSSVVPFPDGAIAPHLQVDRSSATDALLELALYPKVKTNVRAGVFLIGLHRYGSGPKARWLVDYWAPHGSTSTPAAAG